jgi:phospholipase C
MFSAENAWRIYHDALDPSPLTYQISPSIWPYEKAPYRASMERFYEDAHHGTLPAYAFIEPRIVGADNDGRIHNDQHPTCDIRIGENLINQIFQAVAASPCWERTFFIITYDEHGGFFDHVQPAAAVPPGNTDPATNECGFKFDRFGIRVPGVLISPYIEAGTVYHPTDPTGTQDTKVAYDHTAIIKTVRNRWGIKEALTQRDASSIDLSSVLTLDQPRADDEIMLPLWRLPRPAVQPELNSFQRDVLKMHAARILTKLNETGSKEDTMAFLRKSGVIK